MVKTFPKNPDTTSTISGDSICLFQCNLRDTQMLKITKKPIQKHFHHEHQTE